MIDIDFKYYLSIFWKRFPLFLMVWMLLASLGLVVAYILPPVYKSQASILVESQKISDNLVDSTVRTSAVEQIQIIEQLLMTRTNLLEIAERFDIFDDDLGLTPSEKIEEMKEATTFEQIQFASGNQRNAPSATAFTVSFQHVSQISAARVANELVTRILERNIEIRTTQAQETYQFFEQEATRLANELTDLEGQIVTFKNNNEAALPGSLEFRRTEMSRIQGRLIQLESQELTLQEQKAQIERVIENPALMPQLNPGQQRSPEDRELSTLKLELAQKSAIYSDTNPQILSLKSRIAALEEIISGQAAGEDLEGNQPLSQLEIQIEQIDANLRLMATQKAQMEQQLKDLQTSIEQTPNVEMQLNILNRKYDGVQVQYKLNEQKRNEAATGEKLEVRQKGERFQVIEQAEIPEEPESPNRLLIAAGGIGAGLGAGLGLVILLELLNTSVRRPADLINGLGIQPFATIPYITTRRELIRRRLKTAGGVLAMAVLIPGLVFAVHQFYLPVDLIIDKVLDKFGLDGLKNLFS